MEEQKIAFITSGYFPIPPVMGGAVENLVYALLRENENNREFKFTVFSSFDERASMLADTFAETEFVFIKTPELIKRIDAFIYRFVTNILKWTKNLSYRYIMQRLWYSLKVASHLRINTYDRIVIENTPTSFLALKWKSHWKKYRDRTVYHLHNEVGSTFTCRKMISDTPVVIGISQFILNRFMDKFPSFKGEAKLLKNCIVSENRTNEEMKGFYRDIRSIYGIRERTFLVLYVGRLSPEKGVLELVEAYKKCDFDDACLLIVGGSYYSSDVKSKYEDLLRGAAKGGKGKVIFTGYVDHEGIDAYYRSADVAVFPAMWEEPAGLTIIEAMGKAIPVITTDAGGIPEYVDEESAVVIQRTDSFIDDIACSLVKVKTNPDWAGTIARRGKIKASEYSTANYYKKFTEIMREN